MNLYRIITLKKGHERLSSPFIFKEKDVIERCQKANAHFKRAKHVPIPVPEGSYLSKEIWPGYVEEVTIEDIKNALRDL